MDAEQEETQTARVEILMMNQIMGAFGDVKDKIVDEAKEFGSAIAENPLGKLFQGDIEGAVNDITGKGDPEESKDGKGEKSKAASKSPGISASFGSSKGSSQQLQTGSRSLPQMNFTRSKTPGELLSAANKEQLLAKRQR